MDFTEQAKVLNLLRTNGFEIQTSDLSNLVFSRRRGNDTVEITILNKDNATPAKIQINGVQEYSYSPIDFDDLIKFLNHHLDALNSTTKP
jgi:hypothetical protein